MDPIIICYPPSVEVDANPFKEKLDVVYAKEELDINTLVGPDEATKEKELIQDDSVSPLDCVLISEHSSLNSSFEDEVVTRELVSVVIQGESEGSSSPLSYASEDTTRAGCRELESEYYPPIDIVELKDSYHIFAEIPGMSGKDISIDLSNNMFTLTGDKRDHPLLSRHKNEALVVQEINKGRFKRVLELPDNVDTDGVSVGYEEGILQCKIRKLEGAKEKDNTEEKVEQKDIQQQQEVHAKDDKETSENTTQEQDHAANKFTRNMTKGGKKRSSCAIQ